MHLRNAAEFAEQEAQRAELTITWLEEHAKEIDDPSAVLICMRGAVQTPERPSRAR
ncbi:MAG: hypothetical protein M3O98_02610 [Actinomycetota bacterium]|nr:hypothetical protein [Actinomycetota bacterium]